MIILIAGASHTGKTLLAQRLLEKYNYPYLSIDHLKMGLIRSKNTNLTPDDSDEKLTKYLWPIVREIIKTNIENSQNLIVEGCYIPFNYKEDFEDKYLDSIKYVCLIMTSEYIDRHYEDIIEHENKIEKRLYESDINIENLKKENINNLKMCKKYNNDYILIDKKYDVDFKI